MDPNRRLLAYLKPEWRTLALGLVCMAGYAILSGFSIGMVYPVIDGLFAPDPPVSTVATSPTGQGLPGRLLDVAGIAFSPMRGLHLSEDVRLNYLVAARRQ